MNDSTEVKRRKKPGQIDAQDYSPGTNINVNPNNQWYQWTSTATGEVTVVRRYPAGWRMEREETTE
jgi:hypothetical protein